MDTLEEQIAEIEGTIGHGAQLTCDAMHPHLEWGAEDGGTRTPVCCSLPYGHHGRKHRATTGPAIARCCVARGNSDLLVHEW